MSAQAQAKAARRKARIDPRYKSGKSADAATRARRYAITVERQKQMAQRKVSKK